MKHVVLLFGVLLLIGLPVFGDTIGQNYEKAGAYVSGGGRLRIDLGQFLDDQSDFANINLDISPEVGRFPIDNLCVWLSPNLYWRKTTYDGGDTYSDMWVGLQTGLYWSFVRAPEAQTGLVWTVGIGGGLELYRDLDDLIGGIVDVDKVTSTTVNLFPELRLYTFIRPRVALYLRYTAAIGYLLAAKDDAGINIERIDFTERLTLDNTVRFGVALFMRNRDVAFRPER